MILYELLTGSTPIERETFKKAALDEMLRLIREVEPPTPSSRISTSESLPSLAATRQIEPSRLGRFVRGDLDWIVMKALAKERQRRYESPIALVARHRAVLEPRAGERGPADGGVPVQEVRATEPAAGDRVVADAPGAVWAGSLGLIEARRQTVEKEKARNAEARQREQAERRLTQIEKANEILGSIFQDLNPRTAERGQATIGAPG